MSNLAGTVVGKVSIFDRLAKLIYRHGRACMPQETAQ